MSTVHEYKRLCVEVVIVSLFSRPSGHRFTMSTGIFESLCIMPYVTLPSMAALKFKDSDLCNADCADKPAYYRLRSQLADKWIPQN